MSRRLSNGTRWLQPAGISAAQVQLGKLYSVGNGVPRDLNLAVDWLSKAAESGDPEAKTTLAMLHLHGEGTIRDPARAQELLRQAADARSCGRGDAIGSPVFRQIRGRAKRERRTDVVPERQPRRVTSRLNSPSVRSIWKGAASRKISKRRCRGSREQRTITMHHRNFSSRSCIAPVRACRRIWRGRSLGTSSRLSTVIDSRNSILPSCSPRGRAANRIRQRHSRGSKRLPSRAWRRRSLRSAMLIARAGEWRRREDLARRWYEAAARQGNEVAKSAWNNNSFKTKANYLLSNGNIAGMPEVLAHFERWAAARGCELFGRGLGRFARQTCAGDP